MKRFFRRANIAEPMGAAYSAPGLFLGEPL